MSNFGDLVKRLRKERSLTLEAVAKKIGSHKGYVSGIENDKVNPPSVKIIKKFAKLFSQDERTLVRIAWADKAPAIIREDAQRVMALADTEGASPVDLSRVPLLNTLATGYAAELSADGRVKPSVNATLTLPKSRLPLDAAARLAVFQPDVILLDIRLPDLSGLQVCRHFQSYKKSRNVPILTMSAYGGEIDPVEVRRSGADGFLPKPLRLMDLKKRIEAMVG